MEDAGWNRANEPAAPRSPHARRGRGRTVLRAPRRTRLPAALARRPGRRRRPGSAHSAIPAPWTPDRSGELQEEIDAWPSPEQARQADGPATIETYTVKHARDSARTGIVIGRLDADGRRFVARGDEHDAALLDLLTPPEPIGAQVYVRSFGFGNRVTTTRARMDELFPPEP